MATNIRDMVFELIESAPEQFEDVLHAYRTTYSEAAAEPAPLPPAPVAPAPVEATDGTSGSPTGTTSDRFLEFLANKRAATNGGSDHPDFHRPGWRD